MDPIRTPASRPRSWFLTSAQLQRACGKLGGVDQEQPRRAWLLMAAGDNRGHGGNSGYDDQFDAHYSWDSNVPNHKKLKIGDPIALWDKDRLLGASVIEQIQLSKGTKLLYRCPACSTTRISERKRSDPRYRCMRCRHEFSTPQADLVEVDLYRARYDAAWTSLDGLLQVSTAAENGPRRDG